MGDLEDFDFVLSKFQELNSIWQEMADDYRLLMDRYRTDTRASEHSTVIFLLFLLDQDHLLWTPNTEIQSTVIPPPPKKKNSNWRPGKGCSRSQQRIICIDLKSNDISLKLIIC